MKKMFSIGLLALFLVLLTGCEEPKKNKGEEPQFDGLHISYEIQQGDAVDLITDIGVTAIDNEDGDITDLVEVNIEDTSVLDVGEHDVVFSVTDSDGNTVSEGMPLLVVAPELPEFTYNPGDYEIIQGSDYNLMDIISSVTDRDHEDITNLVEVNIEDTSVLDVGEHDVVFSVTDKYGFTNTLTITITIVEYQTDFFPEIRGELSNLEIEEGTTIDLLEGITAYDNEDGDITELLTVSVENTNVLAIGTHTVFISVTDSDGNKTELSRSILVISKLISSITLATHELEITKGEQIFLLDYVLGAIDANGSDASDLVEVSILDTSTLEVGEHQVVYSLLDSNGENIEVLMNLLVSPLDTNTVPELSNVPSEFYILQGESVDLLHGINAYDMEDGDITNTVQSSILNTALLFQGTHYGTISVEDSDGNIVEREVTIIIYNVNEIHLPELISVPLNEHYNFLEFVNISYTNFGVEIVSIESDIEDTSTLELGNYQATITSVDNFGFTATTILNFEIIETTDKHAFEVEYSTFSGNGKIVSYDISYGTDVIIPSVIDGVLITSIGDDAFYGKGLTSLELPWGIKYIYSYAFFYNSLTELTLPSSMKLISYSAFSSNAIEILNLNEGLEYIEGFAFSENQIRTLIIPETLYHLGNNSFTGNPLEYIEVKGEYARFDMVWEKVGFDYSLHDYIINTNEFIFNKQSKKILSYEGENYYVTIPSTIDGVPVEIIGEDSFSYRDLLSVDIPDTVIEIQDYAFYFNNLSEIVIPANTAYIGFNAFSINDFSSITIEGAATRFNTDWKYIGFDMAFITGTTTYNGLIFVPEENTIIGYDVEYGSEVVIPQSIEGVPVQTIGYKAFFPVAEFASYNYDCFIYKDEIPQYENCEIKAVTSLTLPEGLYSIERYAFYANYITSLVIPQSVQDIESNAFAYNPFEEIVILGDTFRFTDTWERIGFPIELSPSIIHYNGLIFDSSWNVITGYDFSYGDVVDIPAQIEGFDVLYIDEYAFHLVEEFVQYNEQCVNFKEVLPDWNDCELKGLKSVTLPEGLLSIGNSAFALNALTSITIPSTVEYIGWYAFKDNPLEQVTIMGDELRFSDGWLIFGFPALLNPLYVMVNGLYFEKSTNTVLDYDFSYGSDLEIPAEIEGVPVLYIGYAALAPSQEDKDYNLNCVSYKNIFFEWKDCELRGLTSLILPEGLIGIEQYGIHYNALTSITLPASLEYIGFNAFSLNPIEEIIILGDPNRFNESWQETGLPHHLDPSLDLVVPTSYFIDSKKY